MRRASSLFAQVCIFFLSRARLGVCDPRRRPTPAVVRAGGASCPLLTQHQRGRDQTRATPVASRVPPCSRCATAPRVRVPPAAAAAARRRCLPPCNCSVPYAPAAWRSSHAVVRMSAADNSFKEYVRRAINYDHMDLEYTFWQMFYLCVAPARVYRTTKLHKQTKNQWARDDPAFVVVLACMVAMASLAYAIAFRVSSVWQYVRIVVSAIMFDFLLVGVVVASASWWFANARLRVPPTVHNVEQRVEWLYAFDVHCNSYFPLFLIVYVTQFFLVPVLLKPIFLSTFLANTLYGVHSGTACMHIPSACPHAHSWLTTRPSAGAVAVAAVCWCFVSCSLRAAVGPVQASRAATTGTSRFWATRCCPSSARPRSSCTRALRLEVSTSSAL